MSETKKLRRKDLHLGEPDEFVTLTSRIVEWSKQNQSTVMAIAAVLAGLLLGIAGWQWLQQSRAARSTTDFYAANELFRREQWPAAAKSFDELAASYPGTAYGRIARLYAGRAGLRAGKPADAISRLQEFLSSPVPDPALEQLAHVNLALALGSQGQGDAALAEANKAVEMTGPAHGEALIALARVHESAGAKDAAVETYLRYLKDEPDGAVRDLARARILAMGGTPPPEAPKAMLSEPQVQVE